MKVRPVIVACVLLASLLAATAASHAADTAAVVAGLDADPTRQVLVTVINPPALPTTRAGTTPKGYDASSRYQVSSLARRRIDRLEARYGLQRVAEWPIVALGVHCVVFELPAGIDREATLAKMQSDPEVEAAQPMQTFATRSEAYDDPYFRLQPGLAAMDIEGAHLRSLGERVRVAIIDTGVDTSHPELVGRVGDNVDLVVDGSTPPAERHGTAVAGVIAAIANNGLGIVGVAPAARLLILRACWQSQDDGDAVVARCNSFTLAKALARAIEDRASVINLSLAGPPDRLLDRLLERAIAGGAIVIGARPVSADQRDGFPGSVAGVIPVRSAEDPQAESGVCAPGRDVLTLRPHGGYDFDNGSSLAAAQVSGVVALLRARNPRLTAARARALLEGSHESVTSPGCMVNACAALAAMLDAAPCAPATAPDLARAQK